ncbi:MFS transporter [Halalkalibacter okhensis]|uniref:MFS transporter n=1 Tax=Halalkalibacter okhensis TaxID=333138 RepID=A0A0B0IER1_9BACI|nr:MFS transporter [Halalkalibacter okhensis]KHF38554.1 MFS transporter [Halalkalibacter okhensis]
MNNNVSFRFLWIGQTFANLGDVLYIVGLITLIYQLTGSAMYMSMVPFFITMSQFLSGILAPLIIDRFRLRGILAFSQSGKTCLLFILGWLLFSSFSFQNITVVFLLVFMISFLDGWSTPVRNTMVPLLVQQVELVKANSFLSILDQTIRLGAWSVGGVLVVWLGNYQVIYITVVLYFVSSIMMFMIKEIHLNSHSTETEQTSIPKNNWVKIKEGWVFIWKTPAIRTVNIMGVMESLASAVWVAAIIYIYVEELLKASEEWWGYINASFFLGLIIGGFMSLRYNRLVSEHLSHVTVFGTLIASIFTFVFAVNSIPWLVLILSILIGFGEQLGGIAQQTTVQKSTPHKELAKVYSAQYSLQLVTYASAVLLLGFLTDLWGVKMSFLLASFLLFTSFIFSFLNRKHLKAVVQKQVST